MALVTLFGDVFKHNCTRRQFVNFDGNLLTLSLKKLKIYIVPYHELIDVTTKLAIVEEDLCY
jgi:hypothetical protein